MGNTQTVNGQQQKQNVDHAKGFTIKDAPVENLRPLRVVVVGAGFSGILAAIRIPERLRNVELVVYEKNEGVGGVWYDFSEYRDGMMLTLVARLLNKYPGTSSTCILNT